MSVIYFQNKYYPNAKSSSDFKQKISFFHERGVAFQGENAFFASGLNEGGSLHFVNNPDVTLKNWVAKSFGDTESIESDYCPGTFYKRIRRPLVCVGNLQKTISQEKLTESFVSLKILLNKLEDLFETIEPTTLNLSAYGHKIREILLLACMDVESSWSAVLKENEYSSNKLLTTNDYVKLRNPMLLDGYELSLQQYPNFPSFVPFGNWDINNPTESLVWYNAYNKTKHDRENNLKFATLNNAIIAVGAAVVMFHAQFGSRFGLGYEQKNLLISNVFRTITAGLKKYEKEYYIPKIILQTDSLKNISPVPSWDWSPINYPF